jgi:hypothetical protein
MTRGATVSLEWRQLTGGRAAKAAGAQWLTGVRRH